MCLDISSFTEIRFTGIVELRMHRDSKVAEDHGSEAWTGTVGGIQTPTVFTTTVTYSGAQLGWKNSSLGRNGLIIKCQVSAACSSG